MPLTNFLRNKVYDHVFRNRSYTVPSNIYVALYTAAPTAAGGGTEVSGGSYARVHVGPSDTDWTATQGGTSGASSGTDGTGENAATITFPAPTGSWGVVTHVGIFDASTSGNLLWFAQLGQPKTVNSGDPAPTFQAAALQLSLT